jgi:hypothetical protein
MVVVEILRLAWLRALLGAKGLRSADQRGLVRGIDG